MLKVENVDSVSKYSALILVTHIKHLYSLMLILIDCNYDAVNEEHLSTLHVCTIRIKNGILIEL